MPKFYKIHSEKPSKEWEESMKNVLEEPNELFEMEPYTLWDKITLPFYRMHYKITNFYHSLKYWLQRKVRSHGCADIDLWNLDSHLAQVIVTKLEAFKKSNRHGYPGWITPDEDFKGEKDSDEEWEYCRAKWEKILDEMIAEMKYLIDDKYDIEQLEYDKTLESKYVQYVFHNEKNGMTKYTCDHDEDEKDPDWKFKRRIVGYKFKDTIIKERKPELFCKYFTSLWD